METRNTKFFSVKSSWVESVALMTMNPGFVTVSVKTATGFYAMNVPESYQAELVAVLEQNQFDGVTSVGHVLSPLMKKFAAKKSEPLVEFLVG